MYCPHCSHLNLPGADECAKCQFSLANVDRPVPQDRIEASLMTDAVSVLAPMPPVTIAADTSMGDALGRMIDRAVGAVLVVDAANRLQGILTERDVLAKAAGLPDFERLPAAAYMTPAPESVAPTDSLAFAVRKMSVGNFRHMPVVHNGVPVGLFSVRDLLRHVTRLCAATS